jgi:predicted RNA-binding Zn-ribbon protein involved in translation (DUF1610 family)
MASKRAIRRKEKSKKCSGKKVFPNADSAWLAIGKHKRMTPYSCPFCGNIHIGHTPYQSTPGKVIDRVVEGEVKNKQDQNQKERHAKVKAKLEAFCNRWKLSKTR